MREGLFSGFFYYPFRMTALHPGERFSAMPLSIIEIPSQTNKIKFFIHDGGQSDEGDAGGNNPGDGTGEDTGGESGG
jgi:hypothetical protein